MTVSQREQEVKQLLLIVIWVKLAAVALLYWVRPQGIGTALISAHSQAKTSEQTVHFPGKSLDLHALRGKVHFPGKSLDLRALRANETVGAVLHAFTITVSLYLKPHM